MADGARRAALVTGAAAGIGRAITEALVADGWDVVAADLRPDPDGPGVPVAADLTTREGNRARGGRGARAVRPARRVVANAGFQHVAPIAEFPEDRWDALLVDPADQPVPARQARLAGAVRGAARAAGSSSIASAHALVARPFKAGYVSAKHGAVGLVKTLALEGAEHGISATALCPGYVRTRAGGGADRRPGQGARDVRGAGARARCSWRRRPSSG